MRSALVPILLADPLPWAQKAEYAWDFLRDRARFGGGYRGVLANTPGWTFTRASTGYYTTTGGVLVPFASGSLRTGDRGALIEGAGTNLCLQSQTFDNASWTKSAATVSADAIVAPDGTTTADKIVEDATSASHTVYQSITLVAASVYTWSVYAKAGERTWLQLNAHDASAHKTYFELANGVVGTNAAGNTAAITALANGWYRCTLSRTAGVTGGFLEAGAASADNTASYAGDITKGLYVWGAQIEAAAFPSSYIPTTTASATRAADALSITGVTGLAYPLSLFAEFESGPLDTAANRTLLTCDNGASNDRAELYISVAAGTRAKMTFGGATQADLAAGSAIVASTAYKLAGRFNTNSVNAAIGGTLGTTDTSATLPATPSRITFGNLNGSAQFAGAYLRRIALWTRALTDSELQTVTT